MMKRTLCMLLLVLLAINGRAQAYLGLNGLIHTPSAEMNEVGEARIGGYYLNKVLVPEAIRLNPEERFSTGTYFLSLTPYSWIELSYVCTMLKTTVEDNEGNPIKTGFYNKDRNFSAKIRPIKEGKYWPAVAFGMDDVYTSGGSSFLSNYHVAMTKHFVQQRNEWGLHVAYRHWKREDNQKWNGLVGGVTLRPGFAPNCRAIVEYNGDGVNVGVDCLLGKHLFLQATLQNGKCFSGGIYYRLNLLGKNV